MSVQYPSPALASVGMLFPGDVFRLSSPLAAEGKRREVIRIERRAGHMRRIVCRTLLGNGVWSGEEASLDFHEEFTVWLLASGEWSADLDLG